MPEVKALTYGEAMNYTGLINVEDLYRMIDKWFRDHGYRRNELWSFEEVFEDGKQITLKLQPFKEASDYVKMEIRISATLKKLTEVVIERKGLKFRTMKGEAHFVFDTFVVTDYEGHWEAKPVYFFFKTVAEKFLYRSYIDNFKDALLRDKEDIKHEIRKFLNMQRLGDY
jgi:hypothetical protein